MFPTSLLRPKTNVVATWCFRRRFSDLVLTLQQRSDSEIVFLTKISRCSNILIVFFFQSIQYCLAIPFFYKQNLFCMHQCKAFAQIVDIWKFAACCLNREKEFLILCSSLIRSSSLFSGGKYDRVVV